MHRFLTATRRTLGLVSQVSSRSSGTCSTGVVAPGGGTPQPVFLTTCSYRRISGEATGIVAGIAYDRLVEGPSACDLASGRVPRPQTVCLALAATALVVGGTGGRASVTQRAGPHVTNRCPVGALPFHRGDLAALRQFALRLAPHGVQKAGSRSIDYRDARASAHFPTFYTGFVRSACPKSVVKRVIARTADVSVGYPHVSWSASLSYSVFLISRTRHGLVGWAQMH